MKSCHAPGGYANAVHTLLPHVIENTLKVETARGDEDGDGAYEPFEAGSYRDQIAVNMTVGRYLLSCFFVIYQN